MASNMSDFIIETTTEAYECLDKVRHCEKNAGHVGFYSLADLDKNYMNILPAECIRTRSRTEKWLNFIRLFSKRIVRIIITKPNGGSLFGTGCVYCDYGSDMFYIVTNEHVIGSQEDVRNCKVEWFYNTEDRVGIQTSCGVELVGCIKEYDVCCFSVTNIPETVKQLLYQPPDLPPVTYLQHIIAIAHPHGAPKTVTFGKCLGRELVDGLYRSIHTAKTCGGCSGTRLICTSRVNNLGGWQYGFYFTHYAGRSGNVAYNIKDRNGTVYKQVTSDTNNINYSV